MSKRIRLTVIAAALLFCLLPFLSRTHIGLAHAPRSTDSTTIFVEPNAHLTPVLSLIREARHSIRLEIYMLTNRTVASELGKAQRRGVTVRVLLEEHPFEGGRYAALGHQMLQEAGVSVRWANESAFQLTHEKAMVVDDHIAGIFTLNLTSSGIYRNREFGVIDDNASDARTLAAVFDADWSRRRPRFSSSRLVVSPYNARADLQGLIDGAHRTLDIYAEEVADGSIESHLAAAKRRGVRVRLITSSQSAGVATLQRAGIAVTIMSSPYVHAKAIVADGTRVFIGSENLSTASLDDNREAGIELSDRTAAGVVERTFAGDWRQNGPSGTPAGTAPPPSQSTHGFSVRVSADPPSVTRGQELTIRAETGPGASCSITVTYPDGYVSHARALGQTETAGTDGSVSWSWDVGSTVTGTARADVACTLDGSSATGTTTFQIA